MPTVNKNFSGIMNLDDNNDVLPSTHHKNATNIVFRGNGSNQIAQSVYGTRLVTNSNLPATGTNYCIGSFYDQLKNRIFYFVANSLGADGIYVYDVNSNAVSTLLISGVNSSESIFNFNTQYPIASVNILYRTETDGDVLYWTDGLNRPKMLNILEATSTPKKYGNNWKASYLTVSRMMPLISPVCKYDNDSSTTINNLKNRVFQFSYRWVYTDGTKSTFSPWSRLFAPANVDTLATEIDPTKNNVINVTYDTGGANVTNIEITARQSLGTTFSDSFLVATLNKSVLSIPDNSNQQYNFYNSEAYPFLDPNETTLLYSLVPYKANSQELLNGNQLIYGGITEGRTLDTTLNVGTSTALVNNTTSANLTMTTYDEYVIGDTPYDNYQSGYYYIVLNDVPLVGDVYTFKIVMRKGTMIPTTVTSTITVTVGAGQNTLSGVETLLTTALQLDTNMQLYELYSKVITLSGTDPLYPGKYGVKIGGDLGENSWILTTYNYVYTYATGGLPADPTGVNTAVYKHKSRFGFGLCYFDEYGATNGVNVQSTMNIITPEISETNLGVNQLTIPAISFSINHAPPTWAKYFSFVRTNNLTFSSLYTILTDKTYKDGTTYGYLDITGYQENTNQYPKYDFAKGDRVRLVGKYNSTSATTVPDYPILDLLPEIVISSTTYTGSFIKVPYDSTMSNFGTDNNWYIEVYTPAQNTIESGTQVYYEFGETYTITTDVNNNKVHSGQIQNQIIGTGAQPATFTFYRGDVYSRQRLYLATASSPLFILDPSMSDKFPSHVDGLGRPFIQDPYAKETYYPTLVRFSLKYQQGTQINETNIFYPANYDEYDRERGDIRRLKVRGSQMRVFQSRGCGVAGVYENMIYNADGGDNLIQTNKVINQIHYYQGNYGMGWMNTSLASSAGADYFVDPVRGYQLRLSGDGITPISELYKAQFYISSLASKYVNQNAIASGYAKVLGTYNFFEEEYVAVFQPFSSNSNVTLAFNEFKNCYTSFYSFAPEWISNIQDKIVSFKSGQIYVHDSTTSYNNFYGTQYGSSITFVFNNDPMIRKDFNSIAQDGSVLWTSETIGDVTTSLGQNSNLVSSDWDKQEGYYYAAFMRDNGSLGGLIDGDYLKGGWVQVKLNKSSTNLVYLSGLYLNYTVSQRNG